MLSKLNDQYNSLKELFFLKNRKAEIYSFQLRLRANGRNNSQHCCTNNVWSCCVRVGSGVQTDATTPIIVALTMLRVVACVLAAVCKRMQQLPTLLH